MSNELQLMRQQIDLLKEQNAQLFAILLKFAEYKPQAITIQMQSNNTTSSEGGNVKNTNNEQHPQHINFNNTHAGNNNPK